MGSDRLDSSLLGCTAERWAAVADLGPDCKLVPVSNEHLIA